MMYMYNLMEIRTSIMMSILDCFKDFHRYFTDTLINMIHTDPLISAWWGELGDGGK